MFQNLFKNCYQKIKTNINIGHRNSRFSHEIYIPHSRVEWYLRTQNLLLIFAKLWYLRTKFIKERVLVTTH